MPVTFRAVTTRSATPAEPSGSAQDDIVLAICSTETASPTIGVATGFTEIDFGVEVEFALVTCRIYWARRGASALATNWTGDYMIALIGYSGCKTSGSPINTFAKITPAGGALSPYASVTTTVDNCMIVGLQGQWSWSTVTPNEWANERYDSSPPAGDIWIADDGLKVTAGATGTIATSGAGGSGVAFTVALEPPTAAAAAPLLVDDYGVMVPAYPDDGGVTIEQAADANEGITRGDDPSPAGPYSPAYAANDAGVGDVAWG